MNNPIEVRPVTTPAEFDSFVRLPVELHRGKPNWVPPLVLERKEALSPKHNPYFRHADVQFFLAWRGDKPVGRIGAQVCRIFTAKHGADIGHFSLIDAIDDAAVFAALFAAAEGWLRSRGMRHALGPFDLSINEQLGILVEGFDTPPMMMMGHAEPYHARHVEAAGYAKAKDLLAYIYDCASPPPKAATRLLEKARDPRIVMRPMGKNPYKDEVRLALDIFNDAWSDNWSAIPLTPEEIDYLGKSMWPILDKKLVWIAEVDGEAAGFVVVLPNLHEAIADLDGEILPFGWAKLLWRLKVRGLKSARVPLMGVRRKYAATAMGAALPFMLIDSMRQAGVAAGYATAELSWILEDNMPVRRVIESFGGKVYKTYRMYRKAIA